jgi:hypothetical protein
MIWIEGSDAHTAELVRRFARAPKPMAYRPDFLLAQWRAYHSESELSEDHVNPDDFIRFTYARALAHRQPLYAAMARHWGVTIKAEDMERVDGEAAFIGVVAEAIRVRMRGGA